MPNKQCQHNDTIPIHRQISSAVTNIYNMKFISHYIFCLPFSRCTSAYLYIHVRHLHAAAYSLGGRFQGSYTVQQGGGGGRQICIHHWWLWYFWNMFPNQNTAWWVLFGLMFCLLYFVFVSKSGDSVQQKVLLDNFLKKPWLLCYKFADWIDTFTKYKFTPYFFLVYVS